MGEENVHHAFVERWLDKAVNGGGPERRVALLRTALDAAWGRADVTLGDVTLTAIARRVLHGAAERHLWLAAADVAPEGWQLASLQPAREGAPTAADLAASLQATLVEFLTVLGNLTADILTPALHAAIASVEPESTGIVRADEQDGSP